MDHLIGDMDAATALLPVALITLVYFKRLPNIRRLAKGQEPRIGGFADLRVGQLSHTLPNSIMICRPPPSRALNSPGSC